MALELKTAVSPAASLGRRDGAKSILSPGPTLRSSDRMFFTEQLALLLETGSSLHTALQALENESQNAALNAVIEALLSDISEGRSFSEALSRHEDFFPRTYTNLVAAGERGGFLHQILAQLLRLEEKQAKTRSMLVSAFSYPAFLLVFSIAVVIFVLVYVFPKFADLFVAIQDQLPWTTLALMSVSDILRSYWWACLAGLGAGLAAFRQWLLSESGGIFMDGLKLNLPGVRMLFLRLYLTRFMRVMGLSLNNGVTVVDALVSASDVVGNRVFDQFLHDVKLKVQQGSGFASGFNQAAFIPPVVKQMVSTGDESGKLGLVMERLADHYERELESQLNRLGRLVEPAMLLIMGVAVGLIVSSLILPIFKLSRAVG
jgi:type II secretory pathway component PulF